MPKDKEGSAVATLLNEINRLRERVDVLESWLGMGRPRTSDVIGYRGSYGDIGPRPSLDGIPEWIDTSVPMDENHIPLRTVTVHRDDTIYATTNDNVTIPLTGISGHYGGTTYSAGPNS